MSPGARRREVLSVVERDWRGARECSLTLNAMAVPVTHLIKGSLSRDVRAMIRPYPLIRLVSAPRMVFRVWLWWAVVRRTVLGRVRWVLLDQERTLRELAWWCRLWRVTPVLIQDTARGYTLAVQGRPVSLGDLVEGRP
ncbi:MAG: hypothetical protein HYY91_06425 [Candidatus Omnitrophica bacterium]|nr:hypothetical protein [Candidatus Omnitrophota bacterium]